MTFPDVRLDFLFRGARLRVLIVTDDIGSFGYLAPGSTNASTRKFSLAELVRDGLAVLGPDGDHQGAPGRRHLRLRDPFDC